MIPRRATQKTDHRRLSILVTDDGSRTLIDTEAEVSFHSGCGAYSETRQVYLIHSGVDQRLSRKIHTRVLEVGLGTGMAMLMTVGLAQQHQSSLHYTAIEREWLASSVIRQLNLGEHLGGWTPIDDYFQWRDSIGSARAGRKYRWNPGDRNEVAIMIEDATRACQMLQSNGQKFDAVFFDPFDPATNPDLWRQSFLQVMHDLLDNQGRLVTYCVNRKVRDTLASVGFDVYRLPGPVGGKREVLLATKTNNGPGNPNLKLKCPPIN